MPEFSLEIEFEAYCQKCGGWMCHNIETGTTPRRGQRFIRVDPCSDCISDAEASGYDRGYDEGRSSVTSDGDGGET